MRKRKKKKKKKVKKKHLETLSDGGDSRQRGGESGHVLLHVGEKFLQLIENFVQDGVGRLVASQRLLRQMLVTLR